MSEIRKMIVESVLEHEKNNGNLDKDFKQQIEGRIKALENMGDSFDQFIQAILGRDIKKDELYITEDLKLKFQGMMSGYIETAIEIATMPNDNRGKFMWGEFWGATDEFQSQMLFCMKSVRRYMSDDMGGI